ncbi:MAG: sugar phosphate isomerase/epimerase [Opitutaceae bacterium]|nr:sugar phosphate isomerase/epimerase [Opitutaceae bacterium]
MPDPRRTPSDFPFGVSQYTTGKLPLAQDLALLRRLGIGAIEVCESKLPANGLDRALAEIGDSGLQVVSVQPRYHSLYPNSLRRHPAGPGARLARLRRSIAAFGRRFPGTTLVLNTGLAPGGDLATAWREMERHYRRLAAVAADHGVRLALEPLHPVYMNTDTFICSFAEAAEFVRTLDHPAFGLLLDVWHCGKEAGIHELIQRHRRLIFGVHVSDWRRPRARGDRRLPGDGDLPLVPLLQTLRRAGYRGAYSLEIFSDPRLRDSLWRHPERTVARGRDAFQRLWRKACA